MCRTIQLKVRFKAPPRAVYDLLTQASLHRTFTGADAEIDAQPGGRFLAYGGAIQGINVDLVPGLRIVQAWREREFPAGIFSMATFNLAPTPSGGTELRLTHRGVPKALIPRIIADWRELYWERMKAVLGG